MKKCFVLMQKKKDKMINSGLLNTTQKTEDLAARIQLQAYTELCL